MLYAHGQDLCRALSSGKRDKATYRAAIVQNQHLAVPAGVLGLEHYMLYAHGQDTASQELR